MRPVGPVYGRWFWPALAVGGAAMAWGAAGLVRHADSTVPASWLRWLLGGLIAHDLVLAPALRALGLALGRLPPALRPGVRAALIVSGTLALMSVPLLLGYGRSAQPGNRSVLPGNYPLSLAAVVGAVWAAAGAWTLLTRRARRTSQAG